MGKSIRESITRDRIRDLLTPPVLGDDEDVVRIAPPLTAMAWIFLALALIYPALWALIMPQYIERLVFLPLAFITAGLTLVLIRAGRVRLASFVFLSGLWVIVALVTPGAGGTRAPFFGIYALIVMAAAQVNGWYTAYVYAALSFVAGFVMVVLDHQGQIAAPIATPLSAWLTQVAIMVMLMAVGHFVVRRSEHALRRARYELDEREKAEASLRESEERYRLISSVTSDYTFSSRFNAQGKLGNTLLTGAFEAISGYTPEQFQAVGGWRATLHPDDLAQDDRDMAALHENRRVVTEVRIIRKDGDIRWVRVYAQPVWDAGRNRLVGVDGGVQDITEEKRLASELQRYTAQLEQMVEERTSQLRRAKEQIEVILNNAGDAIALARPNGDIQARNPAFVAMFGDQVSQRIERLIWVTACDERDDSVAQALVNVINDHTHQQVETQVILKDGCERDIELAFIPVSLADEADQHGFLVSAHDITHLKEIERFKTRFVADAFHDLATPISGLSTRLYLLAHSPDRLDYHISAFQNQVEHLRNLLDDLRTLSQLDRGQLSLNPENCNLNQVAMRVFDTYEPVAIDKQQSLKLITDPALPDIPLDNRQIERVLVNLVSNAINYTPEHKAICVQTASEDGSVIFAVSDEGIGIDAEDLPHIFERFYRTDQARNAQSGGTGLGLAIVKEVVELHGGTLTVASEPGRGSTFTVRLPSRR